MAFAPIVYKFDLCEDTFFLTFQSWCKLSRAKVGSWRFLLFYWIASWELDDSWYLFFLKAIKEYINSALKRVQQSTHNVYDMHQKVEQRNREQKTTSFFPLQAQPIYKTYHGHWLMVYVQLNPFQEIGHKRIFNHFIWLLSKWPPICLLLESSKQT